MNNACNCKCDNTLRISFGVSSCLVGMETFSYTGPLRVRMVTPGLCAFTRLAGLMHYLLIKNEYDDVNVCAGLCLMNAVCFQCFCLL